MILELLNFRNLFLVEEQVFGLLRKMLSVALNNTFCCLRRSDEVETGCLSPHLWTANLWTVATSPSWVCDPLYFLVGRVYEWTVLGIHYYWIFLLVFSVLHWGWRQCNSCVPHRTVLWLTRACVTITQNSWNVSADLSMCFWSIDLHIDPLIRRILLIFEKGNGLSI